jgi:Xaa-Pro dipeptidase
MSRLPDLYPQHLAHVTAAADRALARAGREHLVVGSGRLRYRFLDDLAYPFKANPHFKWWLPLTDAPDCWIAYTPGQRPVLVYHQPADYWHVPPADPAGYWVEHFDVRVIRDPVEAARHLPADTARTALIAESDALLSGMTPDNPPAALASLHLSRTRKSAYELACLREASLAAARAHRAAAAAFRSGASEAEIHLAYCAAAGHAEHELPYGNIIGLNEHGATLHYQHQSRQRPTMHRSLLIDAGAEHRGYAADITRTYGNGDPEFTALLERVAHLEMALAERVRPGQHYPDLHIDAHRGIADILVDLGIVRASAEATVATGITRTFFPHGLGHYLGLQVHDVAGHQKDESGALHERPADHPYLRLTRTLEAGNVLTVEPGIYFIDLLLDELRAGPHAGAVDWKRVEHLKGFGGVRIEDDVVVTEGEPENLTRDAFRALAA